jgi:predicted phosphoribosyltransferase/dienelactone hydrolase
MFADRTEAGRALAARLVDVVRPPCVVAAIPRGGVPVAVPIAERLGAPLTVVYARKLTAPVAPELAFGAVDEDGQETLDPTSVSALDLPREEVAAAHLRVLAEIRQRMALYGVPPLSRYLPGRSVVLVDDGLATGMTMQAAVGYARRHGARDITLAVPCASARAVRRFQGRVDRLVSLVTDEDFRAVREYYRVFPVVADEEVKVMLEQAARRAAAAAPEVSVKLDTARGALVASLLLPAGPGPHPALVRVEAADAATAAEDRAIAEAVRCRGTAALVLALARPAPGAAPRANGRRCPDADDVMAAIRWLRSRPDVDGERVGLAGTGGAAEAVLGAAARDPMFRAVVLRAPDPGIAVPRLATPTLVLVGEYDEVGYRTATALVAKLDGPRRIEMVKRGNLKFEEPEALDQAATATILWLERHLAGAG